MEDSTNQSQATPENAENAENTENTENASNAPHQGNIPPTRKANNTQKRAALAVLAILLVCALTLGTIMIAHASASGSSAQQPTMLQAQRSLGLNHRRPPVLRIVADAQRVQRLYGAILKLPHIPQNAIFNCPADDGTMWTLTFWHGASVVAHVTVNDTGCQFLVINGHDGRMTSLSNFWQVFAATIALPLDQV